MMTKFIIYGEFGQIINFCLKVWLILQFGHEQTLFRHIHQISNYTHILKIIAQCMCKRQCGLGMVSFGEWIWDYLELIGQCQLHSFCHILKVYEKSF